MDLLFFISFQPGASIHVPVSIPKCHGRWTCIFLFLSRQVHPCMSQLAFLNAIADGPPFVYFFPARCIHPCPGEHFRMPWPTDLHFFIFDRTGASIHVPVSSPKSHCRRTSFFLFLSSQMHPSMSQ